MRLSRKHSLTPVFTSVSSVSSVVNRFSQVPNFMLLSVKKVREEGREGEPGTVRVSHANKTIVSFIRHRRPAGRGPVPNRWSPKAKSSPHTSHYSHPRYAKIALFAIDTELNSVSAQTNASIRSGLDFAISGL